MISSLPAFETQFLYDLQGAQEKSNRAQRQLSSGLRVQSASDDPAAVAAILQTGADLSRTEQASHNLSIARSEVDSAESALAQSVKLVDTARVAGVQGSSTLTTAQQRQILADQVGTALTSLVGISNTTNNGRYLFSGDSDHTAAYTVDLTQAVPVSAYQGTAATRQIQDATGNAIPVARTAQEIFDSSTPANNVFGALTALRTALLNDDPVATSAALDTLKTASDYLNSEHAVYGGYQNAIGAAQADATTKGTQIRTRLSGLQDADIAQAALEATQSQTSLETSLAAHSKRSRKSLFDYMG